MRGHDRMCCVQRRKRGVSLGARCLRAIGMLATLVAGAAHGSEWIYTVVPGDNLWTFSQRYLDSVERFDDLQRLNQIADPLRIQPGTTLRVPMTWLRKESAVPAVVDAISGRATLRRSTGETSDARDGDRVYLGDSLFTAADASLAIRFADGSVLTLHEDSELVFDQLSAHGRTGMVDSRLRLLKGRINTRVEPAEGPGSRFEIHTPSAVSAVRGTDYRASVDLSARSSSIEVLGGNVAVTGADTEELVPRGYGTQVREGKAPIAPRLLLPAPAVEPVPDRIRSIGHLLQWSPVEGAGSYRIELSASSDFETLDWDVLTDRARSHLPDVPDGIYYLRVRAIDEIGLEGEDNRLALEIDARPQAPIALEPRDSAVIRGEQPRLRWSESDEARRYRLEVARNEAFSEAVVSDREVSATEFTGPAFADIGRYFWRLSSISADGEVGPPSPIRSFEVRPQHQRVDATVSARDDKTAVATWTATAQGFSYQVQLAEDAAFRDLLRDEIVEAPRFELPRSSRKARYLRVRSVEADGYAGPWGATQRIAGTGREPVWLVGLLIAVTYLL